ncbi:MAG TPA: vWA domain-containing protein [Beijerinckiaceae bacterium]|nr:vWA domain-containing protein [Beijerinckiaceae bacterium]
MWKRFVADAVGGVGFMFALAVVPVLGLVGAAVDYSRASQAHTHLQKAVDAAALAAGKVALEQNRRDVDKNALDVFNGTFPRSEGVTVTKFTVTAAGDILTVAVDAQLPTMFGRIIGKTVTDLSATASVPTSTMALEVVLVLDNTGSMAALGKMTALKDAAKNLIDTLQGASTGAYASIGLVAFNAQVNVGAAYRDATWLSFTAASTPLPLKTDKAAWTGCVADRDDPYDIRDPITTTAETLYPGVVCKYPGLIPIKPLSRDFAGLKTAIDAMNPTGNTNTAIGLAWGMALLTPSAPLSTAQPPSSKLQKTIVFLTDGINTENKLSTDPLVIDGRTDRVCEEIRKLNINLYTIRVIEGNETLLRNCATTPGMYHSVTSASELKDVFKKIAGEIATLRLSY